MTATGAIHAATDELSSDYFANHARARQFPWTLYHQPLERDLVRFLREVAGEQPTGEVLVVGCGLLHELDAAPRGLRFHVVDIDARAVAAVRGGVGGQAGAVDVVLVQGDVSGVDVGDEGDPLFAG